MEIGPGLSQLEFIVKCNHIFFFKPWKNKFAEQESQKQEKRKEAFPDFSLCLKFFALLQVYFQCFSFEWLCQYRGKWGDKWKPRWRLIRAFMVPHSKPLSWFRHLRGQAQGKFPFVCLPKSFIPIFVITYITWANWLQCFVIYKWLLLSGLKICKLKSSTSLSVWRHWNIMFLKLEKPSISQ